MSKQTAVEYLIEEYKKAFKIPVNAVMQEAIEQALAMEKEQIVDAWIATDNELQRLSAEQYYNEIYGGQDE